MGFILIHLIWLSFLVILSFWVIPSFLVIPSFFLSSFWVIISFLLIFGVIPLLLIFSQQLLQILERIIFDRATIFRSELGIPSSFPYAQTIW